MPLLRPADGLPPVTATAEALAEVAEAFAAGTGPVAVDAERASGFRYSQRAYLVQLRRAGAGSALVDPIPLRGELGPLAAALGGPEWVLHAASQDLPCLGELDLRPASLFDTELAGRLAGLPRVGLGPMVENLLGLSLEKGHGAADWSRRPLPEDWLVYAALDVEVLIELRDVLTGLLDEQGKLEWARQEFEAVRTAPPPAPRAEPWRRTSGIHKVRRPRPLAAVRELWQARDSLAAERDIAPGRVLPDAAIVDAAVRNPESAQTLAGLPVFRGRSQRRLAGYWFDALRRAADLPDAELPRGSATTDGPPPVARWADRDPDAAARLTAARAALAGVSEQHDVPVENLLQPDLLRRLCWTPPSGGDVRGALAAGGARPWQVELLAPLLEPVLGT
ncbi:Ribonuclease D [Pseudonocardia sp. Ae168_Ps1]|uniref:HRDC domain-containing protein n=1 Tax=unclassified Pseudonocardia TaxID=2619320 RepID=UPI00096742A3|nr:MULTISPECIES: ribonuclease D [unclassified Pseudonocardia]OLL71127.1 Ribonuclease D [Pseudonocardia sp. Ae168_Ps1]OLL77322.1 Ribonuclease D [Pseudonocardia sp. Ae150A_Ps1]OLL88567.1 Ribonuclease D [Pseudonocardia sp. Ae263_Ps1]OLL91411.1 Ribonuclease D [Pseudonocardia sp. Ae356_Ps1]OLM17903.1 Ribonuclease D [Pseudonocardia sp. Ae707_Ps1]